MGNKQGSRDLTPIWLFYGKNTLVAFMIRRTPSNLALWDDGYDALAVPDFQAQQRAALEVKLTADRLSITPAQLRSLRLAYGSDTAKIREAAQRLRQR